jgi:hypothetical protein
VHVAHRSASLCAFSTPLCDQCCGPTAQTFFVQPWGGPKTKPHIRHIHCRWFSWNSIVICLQVVKLLLALLLLSAILSCIMFGKGVWVRGGGGGRWVSLASSRPPPPPLPPPGSQTLNMCGRQASGPIKTNNIYCKPVVCMFGMLLGWVSTATHIFLHDLCVGGASAHSLLLDLGLHCGLRSRPRQGPSIESIRDFVMGLLCCA